MEIRVLNYFLAVAREQSIIRAAKSLHLSQPILSTQIRNMEKELGKQLLIRGTKGSRKVTLTEEDMILKKRAEEILKFVLEQLDKGLIDFGLVFGHVDFDKYNAIKIPVKDTWGVLMRKDSELAHQNTITPEDLRNKPLIISHQKNQSGEFSSWLNCNIDQLNIVATYNLLFNASLLVDEGLGYAIGLDKIINMGENSNLCFRPLAPVVEAELSIIWKKYQVFSKPAEQFMIKIKELQ